MLSFVTPWLFGVAVAASLVVAGLHLLSVRTPPPLMLPTARFVPDGTARAVARRPRLNDWLLLLLRVCALLAAGAGLAGVRWQRTTASELRLVVADARLRSDTTWRDSVQRALADEDALVDVHFADGVSRDAGAALVHALRRAGTLTDQHRSLSRVDLTVVVPSRVTSMAGYAAWRTQWPGRVRVVAAGAIPAVPADTSPPRVQVVGGARDDIVAAAFTDRTRPAPSSGRAVTIVRDTMIAPDTSSDAVVVEWPLQGIPAGFVARPVTDTVGAVVANGAVLVGPFVRSATLSDALRARVDSAERASAPAQVVAWWSDGEPAAVETRTTGGGCLRGVAVPLPRAGDLLLSVEAQGLRDVVLSPCGASLVPVQGLTTDLTRQDSLAPATALRSVPEGRVTSDPWWLTPALLAFAVAALLGEWWWRRQETAA